MRKVAYIIILALVITSCKESISEEIESVDDGIISVTKEQFQNSKIEIKNSPGRRTSDTVATPRVNP